jgi:hypothetical protein
VLGGTVVGAALVGGMVGGAVVGVVVEGGGTAVVGVTVVGAAVVGVSVVGAAVVGAAVVGVWPDVCVVVGVVCGEVVAVAAVVVVLAGVVVVPTVEQVVPFCPVRKQFGFVVVGGPVVAGPVVGGAVVPVVQGRGWARPNEQVVVVVVALRTVFGCVVGVDKDGRTGKVAEVLTGSPRYTQDTTTVGAGQPPGQVKVAGNSEVPVGAVVAEQPFFLGTVAEIRQSVPAGSPFPSYLTCNTSFEQPRAQPRTAVTVKL